MGAAVGTSKYGLEMGDLNIKSVGPIAFGPDGILFVADNSQATIFAIDTQDADRPGPGHSVNVDNINARLMAYLGCWREDVSIRDMAVHPASENVYFSVMRQALADSIPLIFKLEPDGTVTEKDPSGFACAHAPVPVSIESTSTVRMLWSRSTRGTAPAFPGARAFLDL